MRIAYLLMSPLAFVAVTGCNSAPPPSGEQPAVLTPEPGKTVASTPGAPGGSGIASNDRVLAEINGVKITESQVLPALYESYGLDILLKVTQLAMARDATAKAGLTISPTDVEAERQLTLALAFPDQKPEDYDELLTQLLAQQHVSRAEFGIVMETNANLRALVKPLAANDITEEGIRNEFNLRYGERVRVRHIALNNLQEVAEAQRRLAGVPADPPKAAIPPEPFEQVAQEMSVNRATAAQGGELPPFARTSANFNEVFIQAAFALKPGEVSTDAIQEGKFYHLIKCEERLAPQAVKFESVRDSVREELIRRRQNNLMALKRSEMAQAALKSLVINEPAFKKQFEARLAAANPQKPADKNDVRRSLDAQRERLNQPPTTTTVPATAPATQPMK